MTRTKYPDEFKEQVVREILEKERTIASVAASYDLVPQTVKLIPVLHPLRNRPRDAPHESCDDVDAESLGRHEDRLRLAPRQFVRGIRLVPLNNRPLIICDHYRVHSHDHTGERRPESNRNRTGRPPRPRTGDESSNTVLF